MQRALSDAPSGHASGADPAGHAGGLQPFLHDACVALHAPSLVVSRPDGDIARGADGFYHADRRILRLLLVTAEGVPQAPVRSAPRGADGASFRAVLRGIGEHGPDPAVALHRVRTVGPGLLRERVELSNAGNGHVSVALTVTAATDLLALQDVKSGRTGADRSARSAPGGLDWQDGDLSVRLTADPAPQAVSAPDGRLRYTVELGPGASWECVLECAVEDAEPVPFPAPATDRLPWSEPRVRTADRDFDRYLSQSLADLRRLLLTDPDAPADCFLAAGAPWFLTLFGRDALWAARMLLPLGTDLAAGTLRTLARRQGARVDPDSHEEPGKILHEVRRASLRIDDRTVLPPCYYGTVDATPLWLTLLHDAWRWGMPPEQVHRLLPHAEAALGWLAGHGDADGDGLLEYVDPSGHGLANQGWKDSADSIRWRDGRLATAPIALAEVQAYGYEAARAGAALLRAFDRPGADRWDDWAERLRDRFRAAFWIEDDRGPYPAVALDGAKKPVDSVTSGFGHLLGTGLLAPEESALLAARLAAPDLDSGFGLRTLSASSTGFNPYGYHTGSVWPHDTAIAVHGLIRAGFPDAADGLLRGLVGASAAFDGRLPELFAGHGAGQDDRPAPYPAACRPQAWAAASAVHLLTALLGLEADLPAGTLRVAPAAASAFLPLRAAGLRLGTAPLDIEVTGAGGIRVDTDAAVTVHAIGPA